MKYQAFISYKHNNCSREIVLAVEDALKKYAKPFWKPHSKIFRDEKEMVPGINLGASINNSLEKSKYFIYFASREAAESEWVQKELLQWCKELKRIDKLIILQLADNISINPKENKIIWEETDAIPSVLSEYIPYIPYYEDLRWSKKDKFLNLQNTEFKEIINRITARLHGKTPADMNDENVKIDRRNKRLIKLTIGALLILLITSIITTIIAVAQKSRADKQRDIATLNDNIANDEKKKAYEQYKISVCNRLASESDLLRSIDNNKAIRIAEAAYKIGSPKPPAAVLRALCASTYRARKHPFYIFVKDQGDGHPKARKLWKIKRIFLTVFKQHSGVINNAVFSPDSSCVFTASWDHTAILWNLKGKVIAELKDHTDRVYIAMFSPDGSRLITSSGYSTTKLWNLKGKMLAEFKGHIANITNTVFSPNSSHVLTIGNNAKLWDLDGKMLTELKGHNGDIYSAVFSPDGSRILTSSVDHTAKLWNLEGRMLSGLEGHSADVTSAVFSPNGSLILTASLDNTAKLWDLNGKMLAEFIGHKNWVTRAIFSPDASRVLTVSSDNTSKLWNLKGEKLVELNRHFGEINSAVFSPDGSRILTASSDNTAMLWDLEGNILAELKEHNSGVSSAMFSTDGKYIVTASRDKTAIIWPTPETIMDWLKIAPIPKLTKQEKKELGVENFKID